MFPGQQGISDTLILIYFLSLTRLSTYLSSRYFSVVILSEVPPHTLYKNCIDIHLYLMKILSNNNATVQDYQPSIPTAPHWSGLRGNSVCTISSLSYVGTCNVDPYNWIFDCDDANPFWQQVWNLYSVNICRDINNRTYCKYYITGAKPWFVLLYCNTS